MSFWTKHFNQAARIEALETETLSRNREILFLEREKVLLEGEVTKLKWECDQNAKQVTLERNRRDKDTKAHHQVLAQVVGADRKVYVEPKAPEEPKPVELTQQQKDSIQFMAQAMLDDDVANGDMPLPLEQYEQLIISKGDEYLPLIAEN